MKKFVILLLVIFLVALTAAACGGDEPTPEPPTATPIPPTVAPPAPAGDATAGEAIFTQTCIACHGAGGVGVQGLGKPFTTSEFLASQSDEQLLAFLKVGRAPDDPLNTTGVLMPPKGGNPALTDEQLLDVIAYVRTLHE